ncbi:MAG: transglycosylase SLT domain-containing protein [Methylococcaceae bacterium]
MNINYLCRSVLLSGLVFLPGTILGYTLDQQRIDFLKAEKLLEQKNDETFLTLSSTLTDYPLYPYLQYQWLKNNLQQSDKIQLFLSTYKDTRYAQLLRSKWLGYLAQKERWDEFTQHYQPDDNAALECQFNWSLYNSGKKQQALTEAKRLWTLGYMQPNECDPLLSALVMSPVLTSELIWQRFELALKNDNVSEAVYVKQLLDKFNQNIADLWLQVHKKPSLIQDNRFWHQTMGRIFAHGVDRMLKSDLNLAIALWESKKSFFTLDDQTTQKLERKIALELAHRRDSRAYNRLNQLVNIDEEVREWKVRSSLFEQNWPHVIAALAGLTPEEQQEPRWQYWQARSMAATGDTVQAQNHYTKLAEDRGFYGFLAADIINKPYNLTDKPVLLAGNELNALANETDFKVIEELNFFNKELEARRQWWFAIKKLSNERIMIAAKLAQAWKWDQIAIMTLVKADYWDDLALRFPVNYLSQILENSNQQNLDPAVAFGLIRQESMLDKNARSAVGARGLMQIMPQTGKQIASTLNELWQSENSLFNPDINIKYGIHYYKQLLNQFAGHFALATAAYNAGPNRVRKWLPSDKPVPADIWIETIPYKETRKYVTSVFSYAMIYQNRLHRNELKMKNLMLDVLPG